jgi:hypothetical protein
MKIIKEYLEENKDNVELLKNLVSECNSWDSSLDYLRVEENDEEFFNIYFEGRPQEVARSVYFGDYRYCDEYVYFNGYGNLESMTGWQYEDKLKENANEIIERALELVEDNSINIDYLIKESEDNEDER